MKAPILVSDWERLCQQLPGRVLYAATEGAPELFEEAKKGGPCVLVTACSDLCITQQQREHPNADLLKTAVATDWNAACGQRGRYVGVQVGPACDPLRCRESDRYSLKTERWTWSTFDDIPEQVVAWYSTNVNLEHERIRLIPFGLNDHGPGSAMIDDFVGRKKTGLLYVNFQDNSLERIELKQRYACASWATFRPRANLPVEQYLEEVATHKFVLAPAGNGLDCYRIWESIRLGSWPILGDSPFARRLADLGLPVAVVDDLRSLDVAALRTLEQFMLERSCFFRTEPATLSYWKTRMEKEIEELLR